MTQKELLGEITQLSKSINSATDSYYADALKSLKNNKDWQDIDSFHFSTEWNYFPDSLYQEFIYKLRDAREASRTHRSREKMEEEKIVKMRSIPVPDEEQIRIIRENARKFRDMEKKLRDEVETHVARTEEMFDIKVREDSLNINMQIVDINLNKILPGGEDSLLTGVIAKQIPPLPDKSKLFTLRIPDFSIPHAPKIIRYHYDMERVEKAFQTAQNKNILITLTLLLTSIIAISYISRRFLKPIGNLKSSFDQVVGGNLEVSVPASSRDEIGDLTHSFNQMVSDLRRNREKEKILQRKERLASLGQLAAGVAHEIKNPLNAINLTIEHLRDKYSGKDRQAVQYIQTIQNEIKRLDRIVDNFLNFLRSENLQLHPHDVNRVISDVLQLFEREFRIQHIQVDTQFSDDFILPVDAERMKTVIMNLILNSVQALPEGGKLKITTDTKQRQIIIEDSGVGIDEAEEEKIFDLFYTTKSKGTGLGLPTAYKIIKEHGGDIQIESRKNEGTKITISLK